MNECRELENNEQQAKSAGRIALERSGCSAELQDAAMEAERAPSPEALVSRRLNATSASQSLERRSQLAHSSLSCERINNVSKDNKQASLAYLLTFFRACRVQLLQYGSRMLGAGSTPFLPSCVGNCGFP